MPSTIVVGQTHRNEATSLGKPGVGQRRVGAHPHRVEGIRNTCGQLSDGDYGLWRQEADALHIWGGCDSAGGWIWIARHRSEVDYQVRLTAKCTFLSECVTNLNANSET
jgi:hypothetical protein